MYEVSQVLSRLDVAFDDPKSVASAGLILPMSVAQQLGVEQLIDEVLPSTGYGGHRNGGAKALTLVSSLLAGGEFISDVAVLGSGATGRVLGHRVVSPSRCGQWLRLLTAADVSALSWVNSALVASAWRARLGPDTDGGGEPGSAGSDGNRLVLDIDSTVIETYGDHKEGTSRRNYQGVKGYHPLLLAEASTGQVISGMLRDGNAAPAKDAASFVDDTLNRVSKSVAADTNTVLRADSGFYTKGVVEACINNNVHYTITIRQYRSVRQLINDIPNNQYQRVSRTATEQVDIAGVDYQIKGRAGTDPIDCRLIIHAPI
ncbi:MAG: transposase, partial [Actinomycetota bacterium]|nr:transposase [Actinomycetota bacterium]